MAKLTETPNPTGETAKKQLNPYEGYQISAFLRGIKFLYKGDELDARNLSEKQLEVLAADVKFEHITKKPIKS